MQIKNDCPLCGHNELFLFKELKSFDFPLKYFQCINCGFVFQRHGESQASDPVFYEKIYRKVYQQSESPTEKDLSIQRQRAELVINRLKEHVPQELTSAIDIGSSAGILLQAIQKAFHGQVTGVEPGIMYRSYSESKGLKVYPSLEEYINTTTGRVDLITMMHVLEHLPDPVKYLSYLRDQILKKEGLLAIEVPNLYAHDSFELAHLSCFTRHSLAQMLKKAGFQVKYSAIHGLPRSRILGLYIFVLAKPIHKLEQEDSIIAERFVKLKFTLGRGYRRAVQKLLPQISWIPIRTGNAND